MQDKKYVLGLLGAAHSGKDTTADFIQEELCGTTARLAFADPLKEFAKYVFGFSHESLYGPSHLRNVPNESFNDATAWLDAEKRMHGFVHAWLVRIYGSALDERVDKLEFRITSWFTDLGNETLAAETGLTPRRMLQTLGTDCCRAFDEDIWARYGIADGKRLLLTPHIRAAVITDFRFLNEARLGRGAGAVIWRIWRPGSRLEGPAGKHASELEIYSSEMTQYVTREIHNEGTLDDLRATVAGYLNDLYER